jgi:hypothetical protein
MAGRNVYVVSVLGQDLFWDGFGDLIPDINSAGQYSTFAEAESGFSTCQAIYSMGFGYGGFEIRTMLIFRSR